MKPLHPESEKAKSITYAVAKMMFVDLRPFSIVEDEGFRQVLKTSEPRYTVPSRTTFRTKVLPALYEECASKVKCAIKSYHEQYGSNTLYSVTTDGWTSSSNILYLSYTLHIPGEGCEITSFGLGTVELPNKHTAQNLRSHLISTLQEWEILPKSEVKVGSSNESYAQQQEIESDEDSDDPEAIGKYC